MGKAVVYVFIATAFAVFLLFSSSDSHGRNHQGPIRRLGNQFQNPNFDPLVEKIERYAEEKGKSIKEEKTSLVKEIPDAYKYYNDEGRLNISLRLMVLFPALDQSPNDGVISFNELRDWIREQAMERLNYRTQKELTFYDKNGDGFISFGEYLPQFSEEDIENNGMRHGEAGWWKEQFTNADADQNGLLDFDELKDFLNPEDSSNHQIQDWLLREKMKRMSYDSDGKLDYVEFLHHVYEIYRSYIEFETHGDSIPTAEEKFAELDIDKDKFLTVEELKPLLHYLHPGELSFAEHYTSHLINEADDNKDGSLVLDEMLNHEYVFYNTVYEDRSANNQDDFHDEL